MKKYQEQPNGLRNLFYVPYFMVSLKFCLETIALFLIFVIVRRLIDSPFFIVLSISAWLLSEILCTFFYARNMYRAIDRYRSIIRFIQRVDYDFIQQYTYESSADKYPPLLNDLLRHLKELINSEETVDILRRQTELATLQSQINPHFLYNTLESIRGQALMQDQYEIAEMTEALSAFFRYSISVRSDMVPLRNELKNIENYFKIQQYRFEGRFSLHIRIEGEEEETLDYVLPKLTLQPILENAISHGLEERIGPGNIWITIVTTRKRMIIRVRDDGVGMSEEKLNALNRKLNRGLREISANAQSSHNGIAMSNVNQRIKLFFGEAYGLTVSSIEGQGTEVEITVPLMHEEDFEKEEADGGSL